MSRQAQKLLARTAERFPPTAFDLLPIGLVLDALDPPHRPANLDQNTLAALEPALSSTFWPVASTLMYLVAINVLAEDAGIGTLCWAKSFQDALATVRSIYSDTPSDSQDRLPLRHSAQANLAQTILAQTLPRIDDLPLHEILEMRRKHYSELEAFRSGVAELATQINVAATQNDIRLQVADLISSRVSPAIRNLELSISESRIDALKKIGQSWEALAKATVPFVLTHLVGAPLNMQVALGALGGLAAIGGPLFAASLERKKLLKASQWSIILQLNRMKKGISQTMK